MTINEQIEKAEAKVIKIQAIIERHQVRLMKKQELLAKATNEDERFDLNFDISYINDDIKNNEEKLEEAKKRVATLKAKREYEEGKLGRIPEILKPFIEDLVARWNEYDKNLRTSILEQGESYYKGKDGKYNWKLYNRYCEMRDLTDERIEQDNRRAAINLVENLIIRIEKKAGNVTSYQGLYVTMGNRYEGAVVNGRVEGDKGVAIVTSIGAGGYNIQRYHIRTLVK